MNGIKNTIIPTVIKYLERILAVFIIIGVVVYIIRSIPLFLIADWGSTEIFYDLISRILLVTIGLELARTLVTHSFLAILELLAFVVARKMLTPDIGTVEIFLGVIAFIAILGAYRYFIFPIRRNLRRENIY